MKAKLNFNGKIIEIPDIIEVKGIKKYTGLMFKGKDTNALLFSFDNPGKHAIHSLFCKDFLAVWLNAGKIVDYQLVNSIQFSIKPSQDFTHLLEIPVNEKYASVISNFTDNKL